MRVLVTEDDEILAAAVAAGLRREGVAVDVALDGEAALERVAVSRYDVVVLDRDLPGVHGDDVCRALAAGRSESRVLMLTAARSVRDRVEGLDLGADDYLPKPFDFAELVARIRALARRSAAALPPRLGGGGPGPPGFRPRRAAAAADREGTRGAGMPASGGRPARLGRGTAGTGMGRGSRPVHQHRQDHHRQAPGQAWRPAGDPDRPGERLPHRRALMPNPCPRPGRPHWLPPPRPTPPLRL